MLLVVTCKYWIEQIIRPIFRRWGEHPRSGCKILFTEASLCQKKLANSASRSSINVCCRIVSLKIFFNTHFFLLNVSLSYNLHRAFLVDRVKSVTGDIKCELKVINQSIFVYLMALLDSRLDVGDYTSHSSLSCLYCMIKFFSKNNYIYLYFILLSTFGLPYLV